MIMRTTKEQIMMVKLMKYHRIDNSTIILRAKNKIDSERNLKILRVKCEFLEKKLTLMDYVEKISKLVVSSFD